MKKISILGAGLAGSLLAVMLRKRGYEVNIYERRPDARLNNVYAGRSINLAMSTRGWNALENAGLKKELEQVALPMYGRHIHNLDNSEVFQAYGKNNEAIYSVSRGLLNTTLMTAAEEHGAKIYFNQRCEKVDLNTNKMYFDTNCAIQEADADLIIGSDGAFSALRNAYQQLDRTDYQQFYIEHGYKELHIAPEQALAYSMTSKALHIWPRKNFMIIALPNTDNSFTCTLFFPFKGTPSFENVVSDESIEQFFSDYFPSIKKYIPNYLEQYKNNPTASLVTIKTYPWVYQDKSCIIGDAAHAIVPFYGQGMNAAFEDCVHLCDCIDKGNNDWKNILTKYQERRKRNGDAVAQLALNNFIEMRDLVADSKFLERKKIEKELGTRYPEIFLSVYEMVSFSHTPYYFALASATAQNNLYNKIITHNTSFFESLGNSNYETELAKWMAEYQEEISKIETYA